MYFEEWPKTPRLFKEVIVTEKLDGTNGAILIEEHEPGDFDRFVEEIDELNEWILDNAFDLSSIQFEDTDLALVLAVVSGPHKMEYWVAAQSRSRMVTPSEDNHGFAKWVKDNAETLVYDLGEGRHFGEWWGHGIGRKYGLDHKRFSLFNTRRFADHEFKTPNLGTVPVLYQGEFHEWAVTNALTELSVTGSVAVPGWDRPEGVCVYHRAADQVFKVTIGDDGPKGS